MYCETLDYIDNEEVLVVARRGAFKTHNARNQISTQRENPKVMDHSISHSIINTKYISQNIHSSTSSSPSMFPKFHVLKYMARIKVDSPLIDSSSIPKQQRMLKSFLEGKIPSPINASKIQLEK